MYMNGQMTPFLIDELDGGYSHFLQFYALKNDQNSFGINSWHKTKGLKSH